AIRGVLRLARCRSARGAARRILSTPRRAERSVHAPCPRLARSRTRLAKCEHPVAGSARTNELHAHAERILDERHVVAGGRGEAIRADLVLPPVESLEDRTAVMEVALVRRKLLALDPVRKPIADAHRYLGDAREQVQLGQRKRGDAVQADREAKRDEIEPTAASLASCDSAELVPGLPHACLGVALDLARERPLADPRHVRLGAAGDLVDPLRPD